MKGKINEIFESVQGEGICLGQKQIFVRFSGCNISCKFCDTKHSHFQDYEPDELLEKITGYGRNYHSVSFTGGEPLLQKDFLKDVLELAKKEGLRTYLETNGTLPDALKEVIDSVDIVAMDLKLPTSTAAGDFWAEHRRFLEIANSKKVFLKAVICHSTTEADILASLKLLKEVNKDLPLVLQPDSSVQARELDDKIDKFMQLCLKENIKPWVIPQMHKRLGVR